MNDKLIDGLAGLGLAFVIVIAIGWLVFSATDRAYCDLHNQDGVGSPGYCKKCYKVLTGTERCDMKSLLINFSNVPNRTGELP